MCNQNIPTHPHWVGEIAKHVATIVEVTGYRDRFRRMMRQWAAEHRRQQRIEDRQPEARERKEQRLFLPDPTDSESSACDAEPLSLVPGRSLAHQYVTLAAIHDDVMSGKVGVKQLDPWCPHRLGCNHEAEKAGIPYAIMCSRVRELKPSDRGNVRRVLNRVRKDLSLPAIHFDNNETAPDQTGRTNIYIQISEHRAEVRESADGGVTDSGDAGPDGPHMPPRAVKAYSEYQEVVKAFERDDFTDREVYDKLREAHEAQGAEDDLPNRETWLRNLREYRRRTGTQKANKRARRGDGARCFVKAEGIDRGALPSRVRRGRADA
jgi:hypothetical protein